MEHLDHIRSARAAHDKAIAEANSAFHAVIAEALRDGVPVHDIAEASGYHRNHVGRIRRAAGIPDARRRPRRKNGSE